MRISDWSSDVCSSDLTISKLEIVYDEINAAGGAAAIYPLNLAGATWADYFELASTVEREFGGLDGLLHCAAHFKAFTPLYDVEPKDRSEEHTSELQSLMRISFAVFCLKKTNHAHISYQQQS